ncbi:MAG: hypothetical protein ABI601_00110 [bacterium]
MQFMWADTLLAAERAHLLRLIVWGGASFVLGTTLLVFLKVRRQGSVLLDHFAIQTATWGAIDLALAANGLRTLVLRDLTGATRLDRFLWLNIGLDGGYVMVGLALLVAGWRLDRRPGLIGAGLGITVQGTALAFLDIGLANQISR